MPIFAQILGLIPLLIHGAESLHGPGNGADKKATVIKAVFDAAGAVIPPAAAESVHNGVSAAVDGLVAAMNALGTLLKSSPGA